MIGLNKFIRDTFPETLIDLFDVVLFSSIFVYLCVSLAKAYVTRSTRNKIRAKWSSSPKDVVIFHTTPRGIHCPVISPFALKLETFLRMAKIPYQFDDEFPFGSKGKTPWITFNGKHIADSQIIMEFLTKKFDVKLGNYSDVDRAYGRAVRVMIDEHLYWGGVVWRFKYCDANVLRHMYSPLVNKVNWIVRPFIWRSVVSRFNAMAWAQGTGRHSYDEVVSIMNDSVESLSKIIGNKKFLLGNEPCDDDAAVFGLLAQGLYSSPGAPFHVMFEKCPNLVEYVERIKSTFWPDWNDLLSK
ncbi:Failed axon connections like [Pseudolycoriella hygida]|uniref:Failed axon connections like n=1 Tax=Pseudolycoriella hygida TaxID=35572 RepID=A0A9Q0MYY1_9DIPT|nr:Failed axon connections like [Pseudolycoriella hygida]